MEMCTENKKVPHTFLKKNAGKRADVKQPRPPLKTLVSNTGNVQQISKFCVVEDATSRLVQDDCFTPKRTLCRSPPSNNRSGQAASITPVLRVRTRVGHSKMCVPESLRLQTFEKASLLDAIPPQNRRELSRTPVYKENTSTVVRDVKPKDRNSFNAQPRVKKEQTSCHQGFENGNLLDAIPPQNRRELPRTPVCKEKTSTVSRDVQPKDRSVCTAQQSITREQVSFSHTILPTNTSDYHIKESPEKKCTERTVIDCFTPSHSLRRSPVKFEQKECLMTDLSHGAPPLTKLELRRTSHKIEQLSLQHEVTELLPPSLTHCDTLDTPQNLCITGQQSSLISSGAEQLRATKVEAKKVEAKKAEVETNEVQPNIFLNPTAPQGLECDENDASFLQKIKNVRQYRHLESQVAHLDKGIKDATLQRELLECEAQKIKQDLIDMQAKYYQTVASIQALISYPVGPTSLDQSTAGPATITQAHVKKLRQAQQAIGVALEKADRELKSTVNDVEVAKEKLGAQIRKEEQRIEEKQKDAIHCLGVEKMGWQKKLEELQNHRSEMEEKLHQSNILLATQQHGDQLYFLEKKRAEYRLKQIIKRCEMCVQRHKLLKEM